MKKCPVTWQIRNATNTEDEKRQCAVRMPSKDIVEILRKMQANKEN